MSTLICKTLKLYKSGDVGRFYDVVERAPEKLGTLAFEQETLGYCGSTTL